MQDHEYLQKSGSIDSLCGNLEKIRDCTVHHRAGPLIMDKSLLYNQKLPDASA